MTPEEIATLRVHATPRQVQALDAIATHGTQLKAARAMRCTPRSVERLIAGVRKTAARKAPGQHTNGAPEGYHLRGVSTLVDAAGTVVMQWQKTARDGDTAAGLLAAFREAIEDDPIPPAPHTRAPTGSDPDRLCVYPMGDPHLGMLSWKPETGEDFDLTIAEANLTRAADHLVRLAPRTRHALVINLGDMLHADTQAGTTTQGTILDTDSRWQKVMRTAIRVMHRIIDRALAKHEHVTVINAIGNHDDLSSLMLALALAERYRLEPRVHVDTSPATFRYHVFHKVLIGVTHGNTLKGEQLPGVMAHDQPEAWGATKHRYWYVGHVHHTHLREYPGCTVESFRTLAARDAWHASKGYRSGRSMVCDVLHKDHGRVLRHEVGIDMITGKT